MAHISRRLKAAERSGRAGFPDFETKTMTTGKYAKSLLVSSEVIQQTSDVDDIPDKPTNQPQKVSRFSWRRKTILVAARRETWQSWSRRELHFSLLDERLSILVATCCYEAPQDLLISAGRKSTCGPKNNCYIFLIVAKLCHTCVSAFREICLPLKCKSYQYT